MTPVFYMIFFLDITMITERSTLSPVCPLPRKKPSQTANKIELTKDTECCVFWRHWVNVEAIFCHWSTQLTLMTIKIMGHYLAIWDLVWWIICQPISWKQELHGLEVTLSFYEGMAFLSSQICEKGESEFWTTLVKPWGSIDPLGWSAVTAGSDHCFRTCCPSVRPYTLQNLTKQNKFQAETMFTTGKTGQVDHWYHMSCFLG